MLSKAPGEPEAHDDEGILGFLTLHPVPIVQEEKQKPRKALWLT